MAKNTFLDWDPTASNNTDIAGTSILGTANVKNFDDALRIMMAQLRSGVDGKTVYAAKSSGYTALANDNNGVLRFTAAATLTLTAAATLAANWHIEVIANGGRVTVDPNASETINGAATLIVEDGQSAFIVCDGTNFFAQVFGIANSGDPLRGYINGLTLANNASDTTNDIDIATGAAAADTSPFVLMKLASGLTKRLDAAWAVGTNQGGLDTGSIADTTYHVFLIQRSDTGVVDVLFSTSATSPTMPTNYDRKRRIGSFFRTSGAIGGFTQIGNKFMLTTAFLARSGTTALASSLLTHAIPAGIQTEPIIEIESGINANSTVTTSFGSASVLSANLQVYVLSGTSAGTTGVFVPGGFLSNTSQQIYTAVQIPAGSLTTHTIKTLGWIDTFR